MSFSELPYDPPPQAPQTQAFHIQRLRFYDSQVLNIGLWTEGHWSDANLSVNYDCARNLKRHVLSQLAEFATHTAALFLGNLVFPGTCLLPAQLP